MLDFLFLPISNLMCLLSSLLLFIHVCLPKHWVFWVGSPLRMAAMAAIQAMPPGHALLHRQLAGPVLAQLGWVQPGTLLEKKSWGKGKELHHKVRSASLDNQIDFRLGWECALRSAWNRHPVKTKLHRHRPQIEKVGTDGSQRGNQRLRWQGTAGSQTLKLTVPNLGTRGYHCKELPVPRS